MYSDFWDLFMSIVKVIVIVEFLKEWISSWGQRSMYILRSSSRIVQNRLHLEFFFTASVTSDIIFYCDGGFILFLKVCELLLWQFWGRVTRYRWVANCSAFCSCLVLCGLEGATPVFGSAPVWHSLTFLTVQTQGFLGPWAVDLALPAFVEISRGCRCGVFVHVSSDLTLPWVVGFSFPTVCFILS